MQRLIGLLLLGIVLSSCSKEELLGLPEVKPSKAEIHIFADSCEITHSVNFRLPSSFGDTTTQSLIILRADRINSLKIKKIGGKGSYSVSSHANNVTTYIGRFETDIDLKL